jgi:tRNA 2-thiouridine synthesizing protein A
MDVPAKLDARGLNCPLPVLKAQKALRGLGSGDRLLILATDPKAPEDLRQLCETSGHLLIASEAHGDHVAVVIEKGD